MRKNNITLQHDSDGKCICEAVVDFEIKSSLRWFRSSTPYFGDTSASYLHIYIEMKDLLARN